MKILYEVLISYDNDRVFDQASHHVNFMRRYTDDFAEWIGRNLGLPRYNIEDIRDLPGNAWATDNYTATPVGGVTPSLEPRVGMKFIFNDNETAMMFKLTWA